LIAATPEDAARLASPLLSVHGSCALKILSVDISHKSDVGGVRLSLETADQVHDAAVAMLARVRTARPRARIHGFTVQPMIDRPNAHELLLGISIDPTFGPLVTFGAGGVAVEAVRDVAHALAPLDLNLAHDLIRRTRIWRLLQGYRNRPPADCGSIATTLVRLSYLAACHPEVREIDINPLLADERGVIALDARIRIADETKSPRTPMAIKPYPVAWERVQDLPQVGTVLLRPIRPEDEALYEAFFAKIEHTDIRLRFFQPKIGLTHGFLARLTQIDYAREMAFVAFPQDRREFLGVARYIADPDFISGEFGVLVRSDIKGRGLGWALMSHLIDHARVAGLAQMYGHILAHNTTMIAMCRKLGFVTRTDPNDPELVRATLDIAAAIPGSR